MKDFRSRPDDNDPRGLGVLPAKPGACPECATEHEPAQPHNRHSLYYQMRFRQQHGRWPCWGDAMAHCTPAVQEAWIEALLGQ